MQIFHKIRTELHLKLLLLLLIFSTNFSHGAESHFTINKIDQFAGLSNNKVTAIAKDKFGFYWIGTRRGLNYVVNGRVEQLSDDPNFRNREIKFIYTDSQAQLWVATEINLFLYNYQTHEFERVESHTNFSSANAICSTSKGVLICRRDALELYDHATKNIKKLEVKGGENLEYNSLELLDDENILLICSQGRDIYRLNLTSLELDPYENIKLPTRTTSYRDRIFVDSKGRLWISIYNHSLLRYSLEGEGVMEAEFSTSKSNLTHDLILDITEYNGEILVATDGGGLNSIDIDTDQTKTSTKMFGYSELPFSKSVYSLYVDVEDGLFMGTIRDGMVGVQRAYIQAFSSQVPNTILHSYNTSNTATMAFCEDANSIWIATDGNGVWSYGPNSNSFEQIATTKGLKVTDICNIDNENLLVAIYSKGVYTLSKRDGKLNKITLVSPENDKAIADRDFVVSFTKPYNSTVMIAADKVYSYHIGKSIATENPHKTAFATGNLFAADEDSLNYYIHNQYSIYSINKESSKINSLYSSADGGIIAVRKSGDQLWIIRNYSLYCYNLEKQEERLMLSEVSGQTLSLEADTRGNLWITTFDHIISLNVEQPNEQIYFDSSMGFVCNEYLPRSALLSQHGDIYFGGNNGFIIINRNIPLVAEGSTPIELLSVRVDNKVVHPKMQGENRVITIPWNYNSIEIETYAQNRNIHHTNRFQYQINSDNKFSTINSDNRLSLQVPLQGDHIITASYLNNDGHWCSPTEILTIVITPPWWNSTLFRITLLIIVLISTTAIIMLYNHSRERKLMQLHLESEQELSNNKIQFLINISHELRTPLTLIYAPLKRLLENTQLEGNTKRTLVKIFGQSRYMSELINMVLDARRMEAGHGEIEITENNFNEWVSSIVEEFRDESIDHKVELKTKFDPAIKSLNFDAPKCRIVLSNLLMNALRYSKHDGSGEIMVISELTSNKVRLSIVDNGVGLAGVDINSLFNRFIRVNNQTTGSGIGLSYSKAIIEQHRGGVIGAYSNNLQGATFFFEIPQGLECKVEKFEARPYLSNMLDLDENENEMTNSDYPLSQHTILIVDDQEELVEFLADAIKPIFKRVYTASNGAEAFKSLKRNFPSIVVSDVMMPIMDGYELCSKIKNDIEVSHTPIVLLTAKADADSKMLGYKSGADAYISKPFDVQHLLSLIGSQLRSRDISRRYYSKLTSTIKVEELTYSNADEQFMIKLNSFITENIANSIDVEMIAKHMCMSRAALYKKLKTILDIGAMEYVTKLRMTAAAERLSTTSAPITEIAIECGYNDNQYFSKAFKQFHGVSPSQFRKLGVKS
ncbi:MAG: response regulator [Rikenellaceae bacterium]